MKETTEKWLYYFQWIAIVIGLVALLLFATSYEAKGVDNKTINEPQFTERGFPKILDDDKWVSQLIYDTIGACYQGTIRWILLSNPALLNQIPSPLAQRQMVEHCFCVMDKIRKEHGIKEYKKKVFDKEFIGNLFMVKATECVGEYETLPSFFMKIPDNNETKNVIPEESEDSKEELPSQKPKESKEDSTTIFQG